MGRHVHVSALGIGADSLGLQYLTLQQSLSSSKIRSLSVGQILHLPSFGLDGFIESYEHSQYSLDFHRPAKEGATEEDYYLAGEQMLDIKS